jgi:hypothetical protein
MKDSAGHLATVANAARCCASCFEDVLELVGQIPRRQPPHRLTRA